MCWALSVLRHLVLTAAQQGDGCLHCTGEPRDWTPVVTQRHVTSKGWNPVWTQKAPIFSLRGIVSFPTLSNDIERLWKRWSWLLIQEAVARLELGGCWVEPLGQGPGEGSWIADRHSFSPSRCLDCYLIPRLCYNSWGEKTARSVCSTPSSTPCPDSREASFIPNEGAMPGVLNCALSTVLLGPG